MFFPGERYDFVITADQPVGAYWIQLRGLGECGIKRAQQLAILRYARGPYQPASAAPTYDVGIPQGIVSINRFQHKNQTHNHDKKYSMYKDVNIFCTRAQNKNVRPKTKSVNYSEDSITHYAMNLLSNARHFVR